MSQAFGMAIMFIYSMANKESIVTFMFGFQFKAKFLPWVMIAFDLVQGGSWELPVIGICAGYVVYYVDIEYPATHQGSRLFATPRFITDMFPTHNIQGMNGPVQQPTEPRRANLWGNGQRLGN